jgi:hypothetical protein
VISGILAQQSKVTIVQETRRREQETDDDYQARIGASLARAGAKIAWICLPPSPNTFLVASAAIENGMHVVAEKPWVWRAQISRTLAALAKDRGALIAVHYEYCLLDAVQSWRSQRENGAGLRFRGRFTTRLPDRLGIPAIENLGSHLFAIRAYAIPQAGISAIECEYERADERFVSLTDGGSAIDTIEFSANREPVIQRFIARFERALEGEPFPLNLDFATQVYEDLDAYRANS